MRKLTDIVEVLRQVGPAGPPVLVGGQAVNYWGFTYNAVAHGHGPFASKDIDFQGNRATAERCAQLIPNSRLELPNIDTSTPNSGVVYTSLDGEELRIDFLTVVYGLRADDVTARCQEVTLQASEGELTIRVMHPLHCMQSRVHNVAGLPGQYAEPHGLAQLRASIFCLREAINETAKVTPRGALKLNERVIYFAGHRNALKVYGTHGIDVLDALCTSPDLPAAFFEQRLPQVRAYFAKRRKQ